MPFSPLLALAFPNIDPVALQLGPLAIRWYSLAYIGGIVIGWLLLARMNRAATTHVLSKQALDDLIIYAVIGIILGGRIGYVLFYQSPYYLQHPQEILYVWRGGMAFR